MTFGREKVKMFLTNENSIQLHPYENIYIIAKVDLNRKR